MVSLEVCSCINGQKILEDLSIAQYNGTTKIELETTNYKCRLLGRIQSDSLRKEAALLSGSKAGS